MLDKLNDILQSYVLERRQKATWQAQLREHMRRYQQLMEALSRTESQLQESEAAYLKLCETGPTRMIKTAAGNWEIQLEEAEEKVHQIKNEQSQLATQIGLAQASIRSLRQQLDHLGPLEENYREVLAMKQQLLVHDPRYRESRYVRQLARIRQETTTLEAIRSAHQRCQRLYDALESMESVMQQGLPDPVREPDPTPQALQRVKTGLQPLQALVLAFHTAYQQAWQQIGGDEYYDSAPLLHFEAEMRKILVGIDKNASVFLQYQPKKRPTWTK